MNFNDLKVGDEVLIEVNHSGCKSRYLRVNVTKITKTMIITDRCRFRKDGYEVGADGFSSIWRCLKLVDEKIWQNEILERKIDYVKKFNDFNKLTNEDIEIIYNIFKRVMK